MKCLILAAGYATRLYPLTENFPKPLLKLGEKTILDHLMDDIAKTGEIDTFVLISNHKFVHHFEEWAKTRSEAIWIADDGSVSNETRLGAVKDIQFAIDRFALDDDMLVIAADNVLDFSLASFIDYAKRKNASCVMRYYEGNRQKLLKCGVVTTDENDKILSMTEKSPSPASNYCTPPFYYYKKEDARLVRAAIEAGCHTDAPGSFIAWLSEASTVYAMEMPGSRYDIGSLESYEKAQKEFKGIC